MAEEDREESTEQTEEQGGQEERQEQAAAPDPALTAAQEAARKEREERIKAEARLEALQTKEQPQQKTYTRTELQGMVDAGTITEDQRDQILRTQDREEIRRSVMGEMEARLEAKEKESTSKAELAAYRKSHPDAWQEGTPERAKLVAAFNHLTEKLHRDPSDPAVEVEALYAAFGEPRAIEETTRKRRETHAEGASGSDEKDTGKGGSGKPKDIPAHVLAFYEKRIEAGAYSGWDDPQVKKELAHARKRARRAA